MKLDLLLWFVSALRCCSPEWRWAIINLMGHQVLYGQVADVGGPVFRTRTLLPDGQVREGVYGRAALYGAEYSDERTVRLALVEQLAHSSVRSCPAFEASPVLAELCQRCGATLAVHEGAHGAEQEQESDKDEGPESFGEAIQ